MAASNKQLDQRLSVTTGIDLKSTGATTIYTVPAGRKAILNGFLECTAASGITVPASVSIERQSDSYGIYVNRALTDFTSASKAYEFWNNATTEILNGGDVTRLHVNTAATGTSQTATFHLLGTLY